jgi:hypothetical protein
MKSRLSLVGRWRRKRKRKEKTRDERGSTIVTDSKTLAALHQPLLGWGYVRSGARGWPNQGRAGVITVLRQRFDTGMNQRHLHKGGLHSSLCLSNNTRVSKGMEGMPLYQRRQAQAMDDGFEGASSGAGKHLRLPQRSGRERRGPGATPQQ